MQWLLVLALWCIFVVLLGVGIFLNPTYPEDQVLFDLVAYGLPVFGAASLASTIGMLARVTDSE